MKLKLLVSSIAAIASLGCSSTSTNITHEKESNTISKLEKEVKDLEGSSKKIWIYAAYRKIRNSLEDGETITFKNVTVSPHGGILADIYSSDGHKLFDEKYHPSDVGVITETLNKAINDSKVTQTRGTLEHGTYFAGKESFTTFWKSTGGSKAEAVLNTHSYFAMVGKDKIKIANKPVILSCLSSGVHLSMFDHGSIYAATNEDVTVFINYPSSADPLIYSTTSNGNSGFTMPVDKTLADVLVNEDAISITAISSANKKIIDRVVYNNGTAEAFTRVKNLCN